MNKPLVAVLLVGNLTLCVILAKSSHRILYQSIFGSYNQRILSFHSFCTHVFVVLKNKHSTKQRTLLGYAWW